MYENITEVAVINIQELANKLLSEGWILLGVFQYQSEVDANAQFVLGLLKKEKNENQFDHNSLSL